MLKIYCCFRKACGCTKGLCTCQTRKSPTAVTSAARDFTRLKSFGLTPISIWTPGPTGRVIIKIQKAFFIEYKRPFLLNTIFEISTKAVKIKVKNALVQPFRSLYQCTLSATILTIGSYRHRTVYLLLPCLTYLSSDLKKEYNP